jgi:uncharacterized protein YcfL
MKNVLFILSATTVLLVGCANEQKPTPQEQQHVEEQVAKDQAAQDSMDQVIMEQIETIQAVH